MVTLDWIRLYQEQAKQKKKHADHYVHNKSTEFRVQTKSMIVQILPWIHVWSKINCFFETDVAT